MGWPFDIWADGRITKEDAPFVFLWVFLSTTALIMLIYFISLLIFHCVFWPKILAKIKADKPVQTAKQEQILRDLAVGRDRALEDKTQSERTETPMIERTQSAEDFFRAAGTVVSENASLIGDKTPRSTSSVRTCAVTVTAAPAASPQLGLATAKESRTKGGTRWWDDNMMTTGVEITEKPQQRSKDHKTSESKDHRRRTKERQRSADVRTGSENMGHLRTGRELKKGGKTMRKIRFNDDIRTCVEKAPLLSQSLEDARKSGEEQKRSEELRRRKRMPSGSKDHKEQQPRSVYAFDVEPKDTKDPKDPKEHKEPLPKEPTRGGTHRRVHGAAIQGTQTGLSKSTEKSREQAPDRLMELCKTQED